MTSQESHESLCDAVNSMDGAVDAIHCDSSSGILEADDTHPSLPSIVTNGKQNAEPLNSSNNGATSVLDLEMIEFKVVYNKKTHNVRFPLDETVDHLKEHIESLTNVPVSMQKVMFKGLMKDRETLREQNVMNNSKIMVIGSTFNDVMAINEQGAKVKTDASATSESSSKELLCRQKVHKTVLDKYGKPDDVMPGIKSKREPLPPLPLVGMYNKSGNKVRLTFKLENDQLWIGTKERTEKIALTSIKAVVSEEIEGNEEYHLMALQLGPTELSRYWIYWVPAQYADAIKDAVLGNWQYF